MVVDKMIFVLFSIICLTEANVVKDIQADGSQLVLTGDDNYALSSKAIHNIDWKTVSVNGNNVVIYWSNCQSVTTLTRQQRATIVGAKAKMLSLERKMQDPNFQSISVAAFCMTNGWVFRLTPDENLNISSIVKDGFSKVSYGADNYSFSLPAKPANLARVFHMQDVVTFVSDDGTVQMKPVACLSSDQRQLLQQLSLKVKEAEEKLGPEHQETQLEKDIKDLYREMGKMEEKFVSQMEAVKEKTKSDMEGMEIRLKEVEEYMKWLREQMRML